MRPAEHLRRLRAFRDRLQRLLPLNFPVRIRLDEIKGGYVGDTCLEGRGKKRQFLIRLSVESPLHEQKHTLVHEWAHALAWTQEAPALDDHGPHWGVCYALCYQKAYRTR